MKLLYRIDADIIFPIHNDRSAPHSLVTTVRGFETPEEFMDTVSQLWSVYSQSDLNGEEDGEEYDTRKAIEITDWSQWPDEVKEFVENQ